MDDLDKFKTPDLLRVERQEERARLWECAFENASEEEKEKIHLANNEMMQQISSSWVSLQSISQKLSETVSSALKNYDPEKTARRFALPNNWIAGEITLISKDYMNTATEIIGIQEGLPYAWVPKSNVLQMLLAAKTREDRILILDTNREEIISHAIRVVESIEKPRLEDYSKFTLDSLRAFQDGHYSSCQALSTNVTDSMLSRLVFPSGGRTSRGENNQRTPLTIKSNGFDEFDHVVVNMVIRSTIFNIYGNNKDERYGRNETVHNVSPLQYSRENSLISVLHTVSLLKTIDSVDERFLERSSEWSINNYQKAPKEG